MDLHNTPFYNTGWYLLKGMHDNTLSSVHLEGKLVITNLYDLSLVILTGSGVINN